MTDDLSPARDEPRFLTLDQLSDGALAVGDWLWQGYIVAGGITLLTSRWKIGKTTLLTVLLQRLRTGGELAGLSVAPASVCVLSEESASLWRRRGERFDFGSTTRFCCRPFVTKPSHEQWARLVDRLRGELSDGPRSLLVVDTLAALMPAGVEANPDGLLHALKPLQSLAESGAAVLVLHHPAKRSRQPGLAARGTGALSAAADVLIEMSGLAGVPEDDRRRRLAAWSRYDETPRELIVELTADGLDYRTSAADPPVADVDQEQERALTLIHGVLERTARQQTRESLVRQWPDRRVPSAATVWRWLETGVARGLFERQGSGRRGSPHRYHLAGQKVPWEPSPLDVSLDLFE